MRDRAAFLASIEKPDAGFVGSWKNVQGVVTIKAAGAGKLQIEADTANPSTGGSECNVGGVVKAQQDLELVDTDSDDKATVSFTASIGSAMRWKLRRLAT
jgi:hypothetical protein